MIGIVFCNDLNTCPYIDKYLSVLNETGAEYEILIWNREHKTESFPENFVVFGEKSETYQSRWKKIGAFWRYRKFLKKTLKEKKYDKLIFLTTLPAILCYKELTKKYKNKYVFDFRDLSYERFGFYKKMVQKLIKNSYFTCISSPGFADALGVEEKDYVMAHNFRYSDLKNSFSSCEKVKGPINLLHIGITRGEEYNKKLVDVFGGDSRFNVNIVGSGNDTPTFIEYSKEYPNVNVVGRYNNEEKRSFIKNSNMLLYYYPCDFNCNRALANKYYDGLIYKKPLIGNVNTYSGKRLVQKGLGISLDIDDKDFADKIAEYMKNFNEEEYLQNVERELELVLKEDKIYLDKIRRFVEE